MTKKLFVVAPAENYQEVSDEDFRQVCRDIRDQSREEVPIIRLPPHVALWTVDMGDEPAPPKQAEGKKASGGGDGE